MGILIEMPWETLNANHRKLKIKYSSNNSFNCRWLKDMDSVDCRSCPSAWVEKKKNCFIFVITEETAGTIDVPFNRVSGP